ncbi:hypothetical protein [Rhodanobacter sp. C05]|uniref:hypothetical protein n=1 Tax=Rhodanobacter sp. C05 TaxID=1945855 RepID=UPI000984AD84|nr:hypothetical protein [Rhodanobacter sp. C05]OOG42694.1 hypothetical protein B0E51_04405 [Rhodanobacter sp. C05]
MAIYHLISVAEDQLRTKHGDQADRERAVGAAVIEACLNPESRKPAAKGHSDQAGQDSPTRLVAVTHVDEHESDEFVMWVWSSGDSVCIADLPGDDLDLIIKLAHAVRMKTMVDSGNLSPTVVPD